MIFVFLTNSSIYFMHFIPSEIRFYCEHFCVADEEKLEVT